MMPSIHQRKKLQKSQLIMLLTGLDEMIEAKGFLFGMKTMMKWWYLMHEIQTRQVAQRVCQQLKKGHSSLGAVMVGGIFLYPNFGFDKTNKTIRFDHKTMGRIILGSAWCMAFVGMYGMMQDALSLALFGLSLIVLAPFTLV
jgi:hypothetical protein